MAYLQTNREKIRKMTYIAILTAIVFVLQLVGCVIRPMVTFSITTVLLPIVLGAAIAGPWAGAWLGFVFAIAVFVTQDANAFLAIDPFGTIVTVVLKGVLAGLATGIVYRLLEKKNRYLSVFVSAAVCPIVNTGIFLLGSLVFFLPAISEWGTAFGYESVFEYMMIGLVGVNFLIEFALNIILAPVLLKLLHLIDGHIGKTKQNKEASE